ncbi:hypothetical protein PVK06_049914 [Gossypium arboreum]|uniref:Uncharacterized protein n=1 Tax=Gossypium arboreum TaxID=29729 RepID=A0ABR0M9E6_GOSAR|nr:hypothetical protein PVK06_049914 [Gossypium arboreum]
MCDRGFHGSSSYSSTLGARGSIYLKEVRTPPGTMQLKNVSPCIEAAIRGRSKSCTFTCEALRSCLRKTTFQANY